jgi:hypothetical protein
MASHVDLASNYRVMHYPRRISLRMNLNVPEGTQNNLRIAIAAASVVLQKDILIVLYFQISVCIIVCIMGLRPHQSLSLPRNWVATFS